MNFGNLAGFVLIGSFCGSFALPASAATVCSDLASKSVTHAGGSSTTSTSLVNVKGSLINFVQGKRGCINVAFAAEGDAAASTILHLAAKLDDAVLCSPGEVSFVKVGAGGSAGLETRAMNFVCPETAAGKHSVRVQYRSGAGGLVSLGYRSTTVFYAK